MRFRITPRDASFFDLFAQAASHLVQGADVLAQLIGAAPEERPALATKIKEIEHAADDTTHATVKRLNQTFVTPFDRDDIYTLASALDDCMDYMEDAGTIIVLYGVNYLPPGVTTQASLLQRAAEVTAAAIPMLATMDPAIEERWIELNRLENEADQAFAELLGDLFRNPEYQETPAGVVELLKLKTVIDVLEKAADAFESVANTIETIVRKES